MSYQEIRFDHALADMDRLGPADWMARYGADLREVLLSRAAGEHEAELALEQEAATTAETDFKTLSGNVDDIIIQIEQAVARDIVMDPAGELADILNDLRNLNS